MAASPIAVSESGTYRMTSRSVLIGAALAQSSALYAVQGVVDYQPGTRSESDSYALQAGFLPAQARVKAVVTDPAAIPEAATNPLQVTLLWDDATISPGTGIAEALVPVGPVTQIDLALSTVTAAPVLEEAAFAIPFRTLDGEHSAMLTVLDTDPDNFGTYAADGLPDLWQVATFGPDNEEGAADRDPDEDGQDNRFEFLAGSDPASGQSRFVVSVMRPQETSGGVYYLHLDPVAAGRRYRVEETTALEAGAWGLLQEFDEPSDSVDGERALPIALDPDQRFFRVGIDFTP